MLNEVQHCRLMATIESMRIEFHQQHVRGDPGSFLFLRLRRSVPLQLELQTIGLQVVRNFRDALSSHRSQIL